MDNYSDTRQRRWRQQWRRPRRPKSKFSLTDDCAGASTSAIYDDHLASPGETCTQLDGFYLPPIDKTKRISNILVSSESRLEDFEDGL